MGICYVEVVTAGPRGLSGQGTGVPAGGDAGQLLAKITDLDDDTVWIDPIQKAPTPTMTGPLLPIPAYMTIDITITNYDKSQMYHVDVEVGTWTRNADIITWSVGYVPESKPYLCSVFTIASEVLPSKLGLIAIDLLVG